MLIIRLGAEARDIRSSVTLDVPLTEAHRQALAAPKDSSGRQAQVRFFCTSADSLNSSLPALMEYPPICELKVNGHIVSGVSVQKMNIALRVCCILINCEPTELARP